MNLLSTKTFLCVVINLIVCQYTQSLYIVHENSSNATFPAVNNNDSSRIVGGHNAELGDFPYVAMVHLLVGPGTIRRSDACGGTVLSRRWVLTAGHCVVDYPQRFFVVFGIVDKSRIRYNFLQDPVVSMITNQTFIHPQYSMHYNDIALLYMPQNIPFSKAIQPIKFAWYYDESFAKRDAQVISWRKDNTDGKGTIKLKYATVLIIKNNVCKQSWSISDKHICTTAGLGQDVCEGVSGGGPLIVKKNGRAYQIGIVSYGDQVCPSKGPYVFTKVSSYIDWIHEVMMQRYSA
ncbi:chymotrypsin-1-like [Temnothorax americanus]|uniref:chymotrypsin-1-like n=1 Tax=Temnothorax americanus TaxID=1964332 RepID=UPI004069248F